MHARVTTGTVDLEKLAAAQASGQPAANPILRQPGFRGNFALLDRQTGEGIIIGLWESEAELQASQAMHDEGQARMVEQGILTGPPMVKVFEVIQKNDPQ